MISDEQLTVINTQQFHLLMQKVMTTKNISIGTYKRGFSFGRNEGKKNMTNGPSNIATTLPDAQTR